MYTLFSGQFTIVLGSSRSERDAAIDQDRVSTYFDMLHLADWTDHGMTRGLPKYLLARLHRRHSARGTWARFWRCHQLASLVATIYGFTALYGTVLRQDPSPSVCSDKGKHLQYKNIHLSPSLEGFAAPPRGARVGRDLPSLR